MSKAQRVRAQNARERIAAQQAAARRAEFRRRAIMAGGSVVVVIAVVVALVLYATNKSSPPATGNSATTGTLLSSSVSSDVTSVPASTQYGVGAGAVTSWLTDDEGGAPALVSVTNSPLTSGGKPEMLYIGAEFCPYCAAMRWSMAVALSRFGHFTTPLRGIHSSSSDVYPSTPTLTFYKSGYTSKYLTFTPVENEDVNKNQLQATTTQQMDLWEKYDTSSDGVGYPFIDFGNKVVLKTPLVDPQTLSKLSWAQVAADLHNPKSAVAQAELGSANYITAAICKMTNNSDKSVCTASTISTLEKGI